MFTLIGILNLALAMFTLSPINLISGLAFVALGTFQSDDDDEAKLEVEA